MMVAALEREANDTASVARWSLRPTEVTWIDRFDELSRAAQAVSRGVSFLTRHWNEVEPEMLAGLLRSIEATALDVTRLLGHECGDQSLLDETLAARVSSL